MDEPKIRYFLITAPKPGFTGEIGPMKFADGVAFVSFDDTRDEDGIVRSDELSVSAGRAAVMFAKRHAARGYTVVETDADRKPLPEPEPPAKPKTAAEKKAEAAAAKAAEEAAKKAADEAAKQAENGGAK